MKKIKSDLLTKLRNEITDIDGKILDLLILRMIKALAAEKQKRKNGDSISDPNVEGKKIGKLKKLAKKNWPRKNLNLCTEEIFRAIFNESKRLQNIQRKSTEN